MRVQLAETLNRVSRAISNVGGGSNQNAVDTPFGHVGSVASEVTRKAQASTLRILHDASESAIRAEQVIARALQQNPLVFGAAALATGFGVGVLLPHSNWENTYVGPVRQVFVTRVGCLADEAVYKAERAVSGMADSWHEASSSA